jgi:hypothetical protein
MLCTLFKVSCYKKYIGVVVSCYVMYIVQSKLL